MFYRISGGLFFLGLALGYFGIWAVPAVLLGILAAIAGVALLAGY